MENNQNYYLKINKQSLTEITQRFRNSLKEIFLLILSFYTGILLFPLIRIKFNSNPYEIIGVLARLRYHPLNDILRYLFLLTFVPSFYFLLKKLMSSKNKTLLMRFIFILVIFLSFSLSTIHTFYLAKYKNIDMFHDGEQLGVGSAVYLFNKKPYKDMFFVHGAFFDPLIANFSFKLFGYSIGSFYFLNLIVMFISFLAFFFMLALIIKDELLFYLASVFFFGSLYATATRNNPLGRDLTVFLYILIAYFIIKGKLKKNFGFFAGSFLSFFTLYLSIDRGLYLVFINTVFVFLYLFFTNKMLKLSLKQRIKIFLKNYKLFIISLSGYFVAIIIGLIYFGPEALKEFFKITFVIIPKIKPYLDELPYPLFSKASFFAYWSPLILITLVVLIISYFYIFRRKKIKNNTLLFLIFLSLFSIIFYRSALGRTDEEHIAYVVHFVFLTIFALLDYFLVEERKKFSSYLVASLLFFMPFFNFNRIIPTQVTPADVKMFLSLPGIVSRVSDDYWLKKEHIEVRDFILKNTSENDYIFVFTNESVYYYLTKRKNPTRFYTVWFAAPNFYQEEVTKDLSQHKPKYILYESNYWSNNIDGISNKERLTKINKWILENYELKTTINSMKILKAKE